MEAVQLRRQLGIQATKVSDVIGGKDKEVNAAATSRAQHIQKGMILRKDLFLEKRRVSLAEHESIDNIMYEIDYSLSIQSHVILRNAANYCAMKLCCPVVLEMYHEVIESLH